MGLIPKVILGLLILAQVAVILVPLRNYRKGTYETMVTPLQNLAVATGNVVILVLLFVLFAYVW